MPYISTSKALNTFKWTQQKVEPDLDTEKQLGRPREVQRAQGKGAGPCLLTGDVVLGAAKTSCAPGLRAFLSRSLQLKLCTHNHVYAHLHIS